MRMILSSIVLFMAPSVFACGSADVYNTDFKTIKSMDGTTLTSKYPSLMNRDCKTATPVAVKTAAPAPVAATPAPAVEVKEEIAKRFTFNFATNSKQPEATSMKQFPELKKAIESGEFKAVKIVGFADQTGSAKYNMALSSARAESLKAMLKKELKTKAVALKTTGGGVKEAAQLDTARVVEIQLIK